MKSLCFFGNRSRVNVYICIVAVLLLFVSACSVAEPKAAANPEGQKPANAAAVPANAAGDTGGATIPIDPNGPADTVRAFYRLLREKKFREAIFLTNLKPAIQNLNDTELKDFAVDFETIAGQVPAELEINGEIITGDMATVTVKLPKDDGGEKETQPIKLKKENDVWTILSTDEEAGKRIRQEGKNYFYNLRIKTHEDEAGKMLERISKAEIAYSLQHGGAFTEMSTLVAAGYLPDDIQSSDSTGYGYAVTLLPAKNQYIATATPANYGKSGKLSYLLYLDGKGMSHVTSKDNGGRPLQK